MTHLHILGSLHKRAWIARKTFGKTGVRTQGPFDPSLISDLDRPNPKLLVTLQLRQRCRRLGTAIQSPARAAGYLSGY